MESTFSTQSGFCLIIERGESRFPQRPIGNERFLIGAGSNCQLQLGGEMPLLHSIIVPEGDHLWIDAVVPQPPLYVNGHDIRDGQLNRGDVLEIGEFVFCVDYKQPAVSVSSSRETVRKAGDLSAPELLEHLGKELSGLNSFEESRRRGATSLLEAAVRAGEARKQTQSEMADSTAMRLMAELRERARELDEREAVLNAHAQRLAEAQEELRQQLQLLCESTQEASAEQDPLRKSA